jgi:hypothetical protein
VHAWSGLGVRSERAIRRCVRCAAESRCAAAARSGIIGLTIRDSSCCHRMAAGIRQVCGRLSAARSCVCSAATTRPRRVRAFHALGMGVARLAGCDSLARKRPAQRTKARIPPEHASARILSRAATACVRETRRPPLKVCRSHRPRFFVCAHVFCEAAVKRVQIRERRPPVEERP